MTRSAAPLFHVPLHDPDTLRLLEAKRVAKGHDTLEDTIALLLVQSDALETVAGIAADSNAVVAIASELAAAELAPGSLPVVTVEELAELARREAETAEALGISYAGNVGAQS